MGKQTLGFNKAFVEIAKALNSNSNTGEKLHLLVKATARALGVRGCSLMLLDAQRKRFFHTASQGLSERYLRKGYLEAGKSLAELLNGKAMAILDVETDPRVQFKELALQEQISSIMSVPVETGGEMVGILRAYSRIQREFTAAEEQFLFTVANLAGAALESGRTNEEEHPTESGQEPSPRPAPLTSEIKPVSFAHPSEEEFARLLDFYQIEWVYEPRSFPLQFEGRATEMFTPDFYLPALDLYVEMTTMKPGLTREKNRKVRHLRELYPDVNIKLLARRDYDRLLAKYGHGPLAGAKTHGVGRVLFSDSQVQKRVSQLAKEISQDYEGRYPVLVGVLRGVFCFLADLMRYLTVPADVDFMAISYYRGGDGKAVRVTKDVDIDLAGRDVLLVEDIVDTGMTLSFVLNYLKSRKPASLQVCTLLDKRVRRLADVSLKYVGFEVPDEFLIGYGLDYEEEYRNLPFIALLKREKQVKKPKT
ncbi:MAG TPA: hypoxanthine phosphoribosyltransferase [Dehalococcoidia bacterium]|nr:hypoxanthine phosphoribosyltransferase [Dehalococcoidia bacterium]